MKGLFFNVSKSVAFKFILYTCQGQTSTYHCLMCQSSDETEEEEKKRIKETAVIFEEFLTMRCTSL